MANIFQRIRAASQILVRGHAWERFFNRPGRSGVQADELVQPFKNSVWVQRAIKKISGPISSVPFYFTDADGKEIEDPRLAAIWADPARGMSRSDFIEATVGWLKLEGEAFWILPDQWRVPFPEVNNVDAMRGSLILARPDRMSPVFDNGVQTAWAFRDAQGQNHTLLNDELIQLKFWNPYDDVRGLAEYKSAEIAADADYATGRYNRNLMRAAGDQGIYVIEKTGTLDDAQQKQITEQLRMKRDMSMRGEFRPTFLSADVSIEDAKVQPIDQHVVALRLQNRHEIYIAFGVPPSMAEVKASYSIGSASDYFMLIHETCVPMGEKLCAAVEKIVNRSEPRPRNVALDWDDHPVMQEVRRERADTAVKLWGVGMPMEKVNDYLNLDLPEYEGWDVGYLPFSVAPVGAPESKPPQADAAFTQGADAATPADNSPAKQIAEAFEERNSPNVVCPFCGKAFNYGGQPEVSMGSVKCPHCGSILSQCDCMSCSAVFQRGRPEHEVALWKSHAAKRKSAIKMFESAFNRVLFEARAETLRKAEARKSAPPATTRGGAAADIIFDKGSFTEKLWAAMRKVAAQTLDLAGKQLFEELGRDDPWHYPPEKAVEFLAQRKNRMKDVADGVWERVKETIHQSLVDGDSLEGMAQKIRGEFNEISEGRARVIASTETSAAYGTSRNEAMKSAGIRWKRWLTSGLSNVRTAHQLANNQRRPLDEPFDVGGEELRYPGDEMGEPGNVINCHCVAIASEEP